MVPLQRENERLCQENNQLHLDVITYKEQVDSIDLKWKSTLRSL